VNFVEQLVFQVHDILFLIGYLNKNFIFLTPDLTKTNERMNEWINQNNFWGVNNPCKGQACCRASSPTHAQGCRGAWGGRGDDGCELPARGQPVGRTRSLRASSLQGKCWLKQVRFLYLLLYFALLKTGSKMLLITTWKCLKGSAAFYFSAKS